ncbi:hypothetical protein MIZ03_0503 [Rhodoferax lithotrophicus]|uniref:N-acetyltransferase domain-containing protein n=1 Tax=Rhodoferax lithotrophicus TaxID=2798804 RepID=A0ABN6D4A7_9BURK|nr:GNAT family N-acetyltransferase [Rhodoferax sp. MIZ03]BCO25639.1 hypothetical protein MIZ03_0503 [Rhodoferax sp. MIZ03]
MSTDRLTLVTPNTQSEYDAVRQLFTEYANSLNVDLCFQQFDSELTNLPGDYAPPRGALLAARLGNTWMGCCALRPLDNVDYPNACEIKRLYVRPPFRGYGAGRKLAEAILSAAQQANYSYALLDTLTEMETARALYDDLGFIEIPPYYFNPLEGAHYLMVKL